MIKKIGIVGSNGYVGRAQVALWNSSNEYEVHGYDICKGTKEKINACDLGVVCVPTPMGKNGKCDTSILEETLKWMETPVILIKSTVPPGTTRLMESKFAKFGKRLVFSPEFIGENKYWSPHGFDKNALELPFYILGGSNKDTQYVYDLLVPILGPSKDYRFTTFEEAEMAKYMCNSYGATKVTWANEMKNICDAWGISYPKVRELWGLDPRVEKFHTAVFEDSPGFGGKCYPKDVNAIVVAATKAGYKPKFLEEVLRSNKRFRRKK